MEEGPLFTLRKEDNTMSMTIVEFLNARLAEDEAYAAQAAGDHYDWVDNWRVESMQGSRSESVIFAHAFRFNPRRQLAEVAAKQAIIQAQKYQEIDDDPDAWIVASEVLLKALAAVYKDHPDYREEWRP